jgi:hypothetical protein
MRSESIDPVERLPADTHRGLAGLPVRLAG